jgi:hypothetical protein
MKIYMVREHVEYDIVAAYLNKEDAEAHAARKQVGQYYDVEYSVVEWEVN